MSQALREKLQQYLIVQGKREGKAKLTLATGKSTQMLERYLRGASVPKPEDSYKLALACGCSEEEALRMASECTPLRA